MATDILLVSLGSTHGLREADDELAGSLRRAGASVATVRATAPRELRTFALTDLAWALAARRAAGGGIAEHDPRALLYSSTTAALLGPRRGAIRFDAPSAGNRPGRHGVWQRPLERRRLRDATLLVAWSAGALAEVAAPHAPALVVPVAVEPSGAAPPAAERPLAAVTYGANPSKKGLDRVLAAWHAVRRTDEQLVIAGLDGRDEPGVRHAGRLERRQFRTLVRSARTFVTAPRREDHGLAQLEALADGCVLVTTPAPGPYAALPLARALDPRTVSDDLGAALRVALDDPVPDYALRARAALAPLTRETVDRIVREQLLPRMLD